jgi:hypothetical protein
MSHSFRLSSKLNHTLNSKYHFVTYTEFQQEDYRPGPGYSINRLSELMYPGLESEPNTKHYSLIFDFQWKRGDFFKPRPIQMVLIGKLFGSENWRQISHSSGQLIIENGRTAITSGRSLINASDIDHHQLFIPLRQNESSKPPSRDLPEKLHFARDEAEKISDYWIRKGKNLRDFLVPHSQRWKRLSPYDRASKLDR